MVQHFAQNNIYHRSLLEILGFKVADVTEVAEELSDVWIEYVGKRIEDLMIFI